MFRQSFEWPEGVKYIKTLDIPPIFGNGLLLPPPCVLLFNELDDLSVLLLASFLLLHSPNFSALNKLSDRVSFNLFLVHGSSNTIPLLFLNLIYVSREIVNHLEYFGNSQAIWQKAALLNISHLCNDFIDEPFFG